ncbi:hypothetical protein Btru_077760 [Bulinus truncatus]|nr:hypothetical protein Btru_077760 [Bulinus truncatus]
MGCNASTNPAPPFRGEGRDRTGPRTDGQPNSDVVVGPDPKTNLVVTKVHLNVTKNAEAHRTNAFAVCKDLVSPKLVVRRGQPFTIDVDFSQEFNQANHDLRIVLEAGKQPMVSKGTSVNILLSSESKPKEWGVKLNSKKDKSISITIQTPATCYVGKWKLYLDVIKREESSSKPSRFQLNDPVTILFNSWCPDDQVYMNDPELLKEYVLNEIGKLYVGSQSNITSKPWNFGQFESCILDVAMHLLDVSKLRWEVRGNPVNVVRAISALVNSNDDNGIVVGRWSNDYSDGRSPVSWTGSPAILEEYWKTKRSVKYGQCWVFSAVTTTISRALGIPTRSITNFQSAHDTDGSITIDVHHTKDGSLDESVDNDSIWNFHVWNEGWMSRPDLPTGYGGWQAFDATPQETSNGIYCCGPVSVAAIRQGAVNEPYDGAFVFAEVNADRVHWRPNGLGVQEVIGIETDVVGKKMSTKAANSVSREDITNNYKPAEGTPEERAVVMKANQLASNRRNIYHEKAHDVEFTLVTEKSETFVGGDFDLILKIQNNSKSPRTVGGRIEVRAMFYTGNLAEPVNLHEITDLAINSGQEVPYLVPVKYLDYDGKLKDSCMMDVTVMAVVKETDQIFVKKDIKRLRKPHLTIKGPSQAVLGKEFNVEIFFANPLKRPLTKCTVALDGVCQAKTVEVSKVTSQSEFKSTFTVAPTKEGKSELIAVFNSKELTDINGTLPLVVLKS